MTRPQRYAALVCDLDGVVYRGGVAIEHAIETLTSLQIPVVYATNNASRTPDEVAAHLGSFGLAASSDQVITSSQAAASLLTQRHDGTRQISRVLAVGGVGVRTALQDNGFQVVSASGQVDAVVQGYGLHVSARDLAEAAYAIEDGAYWIATNTDATLPTDRGTAPGNGTLVRAVATATGREPDAIAGKPHESLYVLALRRLGLAAHEVLAVGDRLDTDVAGAHRAGMDSLLVFTGVHGPADVAAVLPSQRPTWTAPDLRDLLNID